MTPQRRPKAFVAGVFPELLRKEFRRRLDAEFNENGRALSAEEILSSARGYAVVVLTSTDSIPADLVAMLPKEVRAVATYSLGLDHLPVAALTALGVATIAVPDVLSESCADLAMLLMLAAARRVTEATDLVRSGDWKGWEPGQLLGRDVHSSRLGILGMGRIGRAIARRAKGFDMTVSYHNRTRLPQTDEGGAQYYASFSEMLFQTDFLCVSCPSSPSTRGLVDHEAIAALPKGAVVVNISRGDVIVDEALVAGLKSGHIFAAGLDVFAGEPAYRELANVFSLPHIGSATMDTRQRMAAGLARAIADYFDDGPRDGF